MSDLLNIGRSGVSAYRSALAAVGDNVANADVRGYSRREVRLQEAGGAGGSNPFYRDTYIFSGVEAASVHRAWDQFRATDARISASAEGRSGARRDWLTEVESALGDGATGVGSLIGGFFNAAVALSATPKDRIARQAMLNALGEAAGAIRNTAEGLDRVSQGIASAAEIDATGLNNDLAALAEVNKSLRQSVPGRVSHASLEDERDRLIDSISERVDVTATIGDKGVVTLTMTRASGVDLLEQDGTRALVSVARASDGRLSLQMFSGGALSPLPATGGRLSGLVDAAAANADRRAELESMTVDFATSLNSWSANGRDLAGNPGAQILDASGGAAALAVLITDPSAIPAAAASGEDNGNLLALDALRGTGGAEARWASLVSGNAQMLAAARAEASAAETRKDNAFAARDEVTGVDLDREAADLIRYQQAYNGSAKIIQVARETMQAILDIF